ncbi:MAG: HEAT repeat domain-containing protein, partial [Candidatus Desantisbacteria bacterium]
EDPKVRAKAAGALGKIKDKQAVRSLIAVLVSKNEDIGVMAKAAWALGEMRETQAIKPLIAILKDENPYLQKSAAEALKNITGKDFGQDYKDYKQGHNEDKKPITFQAKNPNAITRYNPSKRGIGIVRGDDKDKLLAGQMSFYLYCYNEHYALSNKLFAPQPRKRTDLFQAFVNGACYWFSCDVRKNPSISIRDINGLEDTYNINNASAKGFDSEMAVAKFLWQFDNPSAIWDTMYKPTLSISHPGYNLQDMINELEAKGYGFDSLLDGLGLRPTLGTVNTYTSNPTFCFDLNDIFAPPIIIKIEVSEGYEFNTLIYSTPPLKFHTTSIKNHTLTKKLPDGLYFWRIKVLNSNLPNLYSDIGTFEIGEAELEEEIRPFTHKKKR